MARLMIAFAGRGVAGGGWGDGEWLVVPVPLHRWRLWQRGYNQSALLAAPIARAVARRCWSMGWSGAPTPSLGRWGQGARPGAGGRHCAPSAPRRLLRGAQVLLVDDV
jgi:hypothetical protein